jgi:pimeloyl-ACP methyl ester carboxylesterase
LTSVGNPSFSDRTPVVLVHGWGGSFASTWKSSGFDALLEDAGRKVIGIDLLGHDLSAGVLGLMPDEPCDAVGFSLGAMTLLRIMIDAPHRLRRVVLAGIGRNVLEPSDPEQTARIVDAIAGRGDPGDVMAGLFAQYAHQPGNDPIALAAVMKRERAQPTDGELASITHPTLVVIGDRDFAGPGEPLVERIPTASLVTLRGVDHFATTENFGFFDAALEFLGALPG